MEIASTKNEKPSSAKPSPNTSPKAAMKRGRSSPSRQPDRPAPAVRRAPLALTAGSGRHEAFANGEQPRRRLRSSAGLWECGGQGGPVRHAEAACKVVAGGGVAA